jgi:Dynamin family
VSGVGDIQAAARALFQGIGDQTAGRSLCYPVARAADGWAKKLGEPMRVAVAGEIKHGKSTLVNALVAADAALTVSDEAQDRAVATGQLETTYVVTELTHGSPAGIRVQYRDDTSVTAPLSELHAYTARRDLPGDASLAAIDRVIVTLDAPMLRRFRLIDTPGFNSVYGTDAAAALAVLTAGELNAADAVIFTMNNEGPGSISGDVLREFMGRGNVITPLKAIGVMPRANQLWANARAEILRAAHLTGTPAAEADADPFRFARRAIDVMRPGGWHHWFHAIVPVAGILGEAAALAPDDDFAALRELIDLDATALATALTATPASPRSFLTRSDFPLCVGTRQRLVRTFSPWGVHVAVQAVRDGLSTPELRRLLDERSGVAGLRELIRNHFGVRSATVRVRDALTDLTNLNRRRRLGLPAGSDDHAVLARVGTDLESLELAHAVAFWQLDVLGEYYRGELSLYPEQVDDLLRLTGERGGDLAARLGLPPGASQAELLAAAIAASRRWAATAQTGRNHSAATKLTRICDAIQHQVRNTANVG